MKGFWSWEPDTESLAEAAIGIAKADRSVSCILDVCTGSGCIVISVKTLPFADVSAADILLTLVGFST